MLRRKRIHHTSSMTLSNHSTFCESETASAESQSMNPATSASPCAFGMRAQARAASTACYDGRQSTS